MSEFAGVQSGNATLADTTGGPVAIGFVPSMVIIQNNLGDTLTWSSVIGVTNGGLKTTAAGVSASVLTAAGIQAYAGVEGSASTGFTVGTDTDFIDEDITWVAFY